MEHEPARIQLRIWRVRNDVRQIVLAERLGISQTHLSSIEGGTGLPGRDLAVRIEDMTGILAREWSASEDEMAERQAVSR